MEEMEACESFFNLFIILIQDVQLVLMVTGEQEKLFCKTSRISNEFIK